MHRRVSMNTAEFDLLVRSGSSGGTNTALIANLKKALVYVITNEISERQRQMITLYYYEKLNMPEIARQLGVNKSTVSRTLARARCNIMKRLQWYVETQRG